MPPNQLAQVRSWTPGVARIASAWLVGIWKMSDVDRIVMMRVDELASAPALNPSSTARSDANRKTAIATLITVRMVRRLLRFALFTTRLKYFIVLPDFRGVFDQRALLEMQQAGRALGGVRIVRHHHDRLLVFLVQPLQQREHFLRGFRVEVAGRLVG